MDVGGGAPEVGEVSNVTVPVFPLPQGMHSGLAAGFQGVVDAVGGVGFPAV